MLKLTDLPVDLMLRRAQRVYDAWRVVPGNGICMTLAERWKRILNNFGFIAITSCRQCEHMFVIIFSRGTYYKLDIAPEHYEIYNAVRDDWSKKPNVKFNKEMFTFEVMNEDDCIRTSKGCRQGHSSKTANQLSTH